MIFRTAYVIVKLLYHETEEPDLKRIVITFIECICFFLGWAILSSVLPLSNSDNPALWRLWAEITPLLSIIAFTFIFWIAEKKAIKLHLFDNPVKGVLIGIITGILWLGIPIVIMKLMKVIEFSGKNDIPLFFIWILAAFLNVIMQELLVRGWLYQVLKQKYNIAVSAIVTSALFTLLHGGAFEAGMVPVVNVLTMSLLMTVILEYSGSLIAPTIMHFMWNGIGALVLGGVSLADDYPHLLNMIFSGSKLLSGGECKIEGSIVVLVVNVMLLAVFIGLQRKNGNDMAGHV